MKRALRLVGFVLGFAVFVLVVCISLPDPYGESYQRVIVRQYDYFKGLKENKVVFVGGSSLSFGLDLDYMEQLTQRPCAVLGNHGSFGLPFMMEIAKSNLKAGDVVVIELNRNPLDLCGEELVLSGIGHRYEMYRFLIPEVREKILAHYPSYIQGVIEYNLGEPYDASGAYRTAAYDSRGNMTYPRYDCWIPVPFTKDAADRFGTATFSGEPYDPALVDYFNRFTKTCREAGVRVYLTVPIYYEKAVVSSRREMEAQDEVIRNSFDAPLISRQEDYLFPRQYIFNAISHASTDGARHRTELLYQDLLKAGALEEPRPSEQREE